MDIPGDSGNESQSNSEGSSLSSGEKSPSERLDSVDGDQPTMNANFAVCLDIGIRAWMSSIEMKSVKRLERNPYTASLRGINPVRSRNSSHTATGDSQAGSSLVGFSNVAGLHCATPFLQSVGASSSASCDHGSGLPSKLTLPTLSSQPNLYVRQELRETKPRSDPNHQPQQPLVSDPDLVAMIQQFEKLGVSTEQGSKFGSIQPLHRARAGHIVGQALSVATKSQSLQQIGPTIQVGGFNVTSDDGIKFIVKTALHQLGYVLQTLTNRTNFPMSEVTLSNSMVALLENVAFSFKTLERHPNSNRVLALIGVSRFSLIIMRITNATADVRLAIERHGAGWNFDLIEKFKSILVEDLKTWCGLFEKILNVI